MVSNMSWKATDLYRSDRALCVCWLFPHSIVSFVEYKITIYYQDTFSVLSTKTYK